MIGSAQLRLFERLLFPAVCLAVFVAVFANSWVCDDAYITFRVVDNFIHGYGLRWNIDERVQVFTHPLWMLLHIPFYFLYQNIFLITIGLSALLGIGAAYVLTRCQQRPAWAMCLFIIAPFYCSTALRDFVISGLETPLTLLLSGWFFYTLIRTPQHIHQLAFIASLCVLTRFDNIVHLLPAIMWVAFANRRSLRVKELALATLPLSGWLVFSLFYYGFIFPNTAYAKLGTGITLFERLTQGGYYILQFFHYDRFAFTTIALAIALQLYALMRHAWKSIESLLLLGILLHVAYVVWIGGDFMGGRFFVLPMFLSMLLLYIKSSAFSAQKLRLLFGGFAMVYATFYGLSLYKKMDISNYESAHGVADERSYYLPNALFAQLYPPAIRTSPEKIYRTPPARGQGDPNKPHAQQVEVWNLIGVYGFYAGPNLIIIDNYALTDPLLARLPSQPGSRVGHFIRVLPDGYLQAREMGSSSQMAPSLRAYYDQLSLVTNGQLFDLTRLKTIFWFQLGQFDPLLASPYGRN